MFSSSSFVTTRPGRLGGLFSVSRKNSNSTKFLLLEVKFMNNIYDNPYTHRLFGTINLIWAGERSNALDSSLQHDWSADVSLFPMIVSTNVNNTWLTKKKITYGLSLDQRSKAATCRSVIIKYYRALWHACASTFYVEMLAFHLIPFFFIILFICCGRL